MDHTDPKEIHFVFRYIIIKGFKKIIEENTHYKNQKSKVKKLFAFVVKRIGLVQKVFKIRNHGFLLQLIVGWSLRWIKLTEISNHFIHSPKSYQSFAIHLKVFPDFTMPTKGPL